MKKHDSLRIPTILLAAAMAMSTLSGCPAAPSTGASTQPEASSVKLSSADSEAGWDEATATLVTLNGTDISVDGTGAAASGGVLTIAQAGTYVVSGTLTDGQIAIAATNKDAVRLVLSGVDITSATGAPIYASQCDKLTVTLADGTQNVLTDGGAGFEYASAADKEPNAAFFCKDDLTINGSGALTVNAGFNNGIGSKDDLVISGGTFTINAANHGIRGNDSVTIADGSFNIASGNDGIQTNNTEDATKGWINIGGGTFVINAVHDAVQSDTSLTISGGSFDVTTNGGAANAPAKVSAEPARGARPGAVGGAAPGATSSESATDTASDSYKGLKATGDILISGGAFTLDSYDDSIHANGNIQITGGEFTISSGDDGVHADGDLTVGAGTIKIISSYEGLEAANINITGGTIDTVSSDDGLNAAGGADQSGTAGFGRDKFATGGDYSINISGGQVTVAAGGDGIDSNGSLNISGGAATSIIDSAGNGALDCDGTLTLTGGTVIYGGSATGGNPGESSTQSYVYVSSGVISGSEVTVRQNGKTLIAYTPNADCKTLALSSPDIQSGQSYEVYSGDTLLTTVTAGTGGGDMMGGGRGGMGGGRRGAPPPDGAVPPDGTLPNGAAAPDGAAPPDGTVAPDTAANDNASTPTAS